jgi:hypothetical protein
MSTAEATRLTLELDRADEPIRGRILRDGGGGPREFVGWLGFAAALGEHLCPAERASAAPTARREERP